MKTRKGGFRRVQLISILITHGVFVGNETSTDDWVPEDRAGEDRKRWDRSVRDIRSLQVRQDCCCGDDMSGFLLKESSTVQYSTVQWEGRVDSKRNEKGSECEKNLLCHQWREKTIRDTIWSCDRISNRSGTKEKQRRANGAEVFQSHECLSCLVFLLFSSRKYR